MRFASAIWPRPNIGVRATAVTALLLLSWAEMAFSDAAGRGTYDGTGITILVMTLAVVLVVAAAFTAARGYPGSSPVLVWRFAVVAALFTGVLFAYLGPPGVYRGNHWPLLLSWVGAALLATLLVVIAFAGSWLARRLFVGALVTYGVSVWAVVAIGHTPRIDVWILSSQAVHRVFGGDNPYTACWTNNSDPLTTCVFPYMPGSALLEAPGEFLFGDIRYSLAGFVLLGAYAAYKLGGVERGPFFAMLILAQPRALFLIEFSWTEPLLIGLIGLYILAVV
jgi:hypothetical protein